MQMKAQHLPFNGREEEPSHCHVTKTDQGGTVPVHSSVPGSARA